MRPDRAVCSLKTSPRPAAAPLGIRTKSAGDARRERPLPDDALVATATPNDARAPRANRPYQFVPASTIAPCSPTLHTSTRVEP